MEKSTISGKSPNSRPVCLEFANTVAWHAGPHPVETLHVYADLIHWARNAALLDASEAGRLARLAAKNPAGAERALQQAIGLREAVYGIFAAAARGKSPAPADLAELNRVLRTQTLGAQIDRTPHGYRWVWKVPNGTLESLLGTIALSASDLLLSQDCSRVGQCADERGCGWLFLDTSKNHSRRWCDARDCGNRARQRRFQMRARRKAR